MPKVKPKKIIFVYKKKTDIVSLLLKIISS